MKNFIKTVAIIAAVITTIVGIVVIIDKLTGKSEKIDECDGEATFIG